MTTITMDASFGTALQVQSTPRLDGLLSYVVDAVAHEFDSACEGAATKTTSRGLTDDEAVQRENLAGISFSSFFGAPELESLSTTSVSQGIQEPCETEKAMLALIEPAPVNVSQEFDEDSEMLDWDMVSKVKEREKKTVLVTLRYAGRLKPPPDPDPWT